MPEMMLLRLKYTNESVKTVARQGHTATDRGKIISSLCKKAKVQLVNRYWSLNHNESIIIISGQLSRLHLVQQVLWRTGAYQKVSHELIVPTNEMSKDEKLRDTLFAEFVAPDQDEIDRMLLDE